MSNFKRITVTILALVLCASFFTGFSGMVPTDESYYMVSGVIHEDGTGVLERIELISDIPIHTGLGGMEYAVLGCDDSYSTIRSVSFGVNHTSVADGNATLTSVPFTILVPYADEITNFSLVNADNMELSWLQLSFDTISIDSFDINQTDDGFDLTWSVSAAYTVTCDVTAVSVLTGERNVVAYRITDTELAVSNDWLDPNDRVIFELRVNDGTETAYMLSNEYTTADGIVADLNDAEDYGNDYLYGNENADGDHSNTNGALSNMVYIVLIIMSGLVVLGIIAAVVIVLVVRSKRGRG
ncbi:MAG: hypothetical protein LBM60_04925 [Clostridium sp.]|jgi:hypothetical protein|nr:hypothetical protein [Clostridium sp.]